MNQLLKRGLAYLIDCTICYTLIMVIFQWAILSNVREAIGITEEWFENSFNMELYVLVSISLPVWIYFTYFDSNVSKGTFGKRLLKLSVYNSTENVRIGLGKSFIRTFFKLSPWEITHLGIIFPTPLYFMDEPEIRFLMIFGILLFISYMTSILFNPSGKSIYDSILNTKVVER